jgi:mannan endo-1,6-alpha-mannosidase
MFGSMIDYRTLTGDKSYDKTISQALLHQVGDDLNYMPDNQTSTLGNDDQAFWGMSAMSAAESNFPDPPEDEPSWLALAQAVFNSQIPRWDSDTCGGGLRWQIFPFNTGYDYKNTISTGSLFNIAGRLARYTGNETYSNWAEKTWSWMEDRNLITDDYKVYDGSHDLTNMCKKPVPIQWSYNVGILLHGAAAMYNHTDGNSTWRKRVEGLAKGTDVFFPASQGPNVMVEVACENVGTCNNDQKSFKAYLSRWMAQAIQLAPFVYADFKPKLETSAKQAALQCSGTKNGRTSICGQKWTMGAKWDGTDGVGQAMSAMAVIQANLIKPNGKAAVPVTVDTGGTSKGNPNAGTVETKAFHQTPITTADKAGAGILTAGLLATMVGMSIWIGMGQ